MDFASLLDVAAKVAAVVATIGGGVFGTKWVQYRAEKRNLNAQSEASEASAQSGQADATATMVQTALLLANPAAIAAIGSRLSVLEKWAEDERGWQNTAYSWQLNVVRIAAQYGWELPEAPPPPPWFPRAGQPAPASAEGGS